jgi:ribosomal-protein-alanine N-acetyltransferase
MNIPTLASPRLILRPFLSEDIDRLHSIYQVKDVLKYFPGSSIPSLEKVERFVTRQHTHWQEHAYGNWAILPAGAKEISGWAGLQYLPELDETEVGFLLAKPFWGQGFASEAARLSIQFGFEEIALDHIIALVHPENTASLAVVKKCGFEYEATIPLWGADLMRHTLKRPQVRNTGIII